jgi:2,4-dienoyl-CoA reductase-like NADH-dependent reductase (Old Yellow Enzyme family)
MIGSMTGKIFEPATLGPVRLRNRIVKAATFEGMSRRGLVSDALIDFHRAFAAGGVAMTTVAYCAVSPEGRGAPNEIVLREEALPGLARLAEAVHAEGAAVSAQIGHAGPVGNSRVTRTKALSASSGFSPLGTRHHAMTAEDISRVTADFAAGADVLARAGFNAVELHMGHHYLLNSFLSPKFNRRRDDYGGSVANRVRFLRDVARAVRDVVGDRMAVLAKWEMTDGVRRGLTVADSIEAAALIEADGMLDALELTGGGSLANPMFLFRGDVPRQEFAATLPTPQRVGFRLVGRWFMREYAFEEAYFLPQARQFRSRLQMPLVLLGGINRLDTMQSALDEGFAFVALGRALLRDPNLIRRLQSGEAMTGACIHCNKCMPTIYSGTHCVLVDEDARPGLRVLATGGESGGPTQ